MTFNRDLFDRVSVAYDERPPFFRTLGSHLVRRAQLPPGSRTIDLGAGKGAVTLALLEIAPPARVTAVDVSRQMLASIQHLGLEDVTAVEGDIASMPFLNHSFDHAVSGFVLHILGDAAQSAQEIARVLRPGGTLTWSMPGTHPHADEWQEEYASIYEEFTARTAEPPSEMRPPTPVKHSLQAAGFETVDQTQVPVSIPLGDGQSYWAWTQSHGARWLTDALSAEDATELRNRVIGSLQRLHPTSGRTIMVAPWVFRSRPDHVEPAEGTSVQASGALG